MVKTAAVLPSRRYATPEDFLCTLTPCIVEAKRMALLPFVFFYFREDLEDLLLSVQIGLETTVAGSKPTELKHSYGNVLSGSQSVSVDLIWITDGKGYRETQRFLKDAYTILPNIYNLQQAKAHLLADLEAVL